MAPLLVPPPAGSGLPSGQGLSPAGPWGAVGVPAHPPLTAPSVGVAFDSGGNVNLSEDLCFPESHRGLTRGCLQSYEFSHEKEKASSGISCPSPVSQLPPSEPQLLLQQLLGSFTGKKSQKEEAVGAGDPRVPAQPCFRQTMGDSGMIPFLLPSLSSFTNHSPPCLGGGVCLGRRWGLPCTPPWHPLAISCDPQPHCCPSWCKAPVRAPTVPCWSGPTVTAAGTCLSCSVLPRLQ